MKKIEENIFYRTYIAYLNKDYPATFVSCLYIAFIYIFLLAPIYGLLSDLLSGIDKRTMKLLYAVYVLIILIMVFRKYYNKNIFNRVLSENKIKKTYLPTWSYFLVLPLCMILGIGSYILISVYIIQQFNLEGYLYRLF